MPNWKKLIVSGSDAALNSLNVTSALTASGLIYPTTDGDNGDFLTTDGIGNLSFGRPNVYANVKNVSGVQLLKGTPVHATGTAGNASEVIAASASVASTMPATFILNETLADDAEGLAILTGYINGVNTSTFGEGDVVYVGPTGSFTNIKPQGSDNLIQNLGIVTKIDATNGSGYVYGSGRSNDVPNLPVDKIWVGTPGYTATSSFVDLLEPSSSITIGGSHTLTNSNRSSIIGGSSNCILNSNCNTITAGQSNKIVGGGLYNNVVGGRINCISGSYSSIINGEQNTIRNASCSAILAGCQQSICCVPWSFIGAGVCNEVTRSAYGAGGLNAIVAGQENLIQGGGANTAYSTFIGAGRQNTGSYCYSAVVSGCKNLVNANTSFVGAGNNNCATACNTFIGAGNFNKACGANSVIVGGYGSIAGGANSAILGGCGNYIVFEGASIVGGCINCAISHYSFIGGGARNCVVGCHSSIVGGTYNTGSAHCGFIGGGESNYISPLGATSGNNNCYSTIAGGCNNSACDQFNFIGGGHGNTTRAWFSSVAGGQANIICSNNPHSFVGGGSSNIIDGNTSVIGGGNQNRACGDQSFVGGGGFNIILTNGNSAIVGGCGNYVTYDCGFIGGGDSNTVSACNSSIVGGLTNLITGGCSFIGGGVKNTGSAQYGFIGAGQRNYIANLARSSSIVGGFDNTTNCCNTHIIGSNLTADKANYTFVNNLDVEGTVSASIFSGSFVGDGSGLTNISAGSVGAAGSNTQIQFNDNGNFGASGDLTWDGTTLDTNGNLDVAGTVRLGYTGNDPVIIGNPAGKRTEWNNPGYFEMYASSSTLGDNVYRETVDIDGDFFGGGFVGVYPADTTNRPGVQIWSGRDKGENHLVVYPFTPDGQTQYKQIYAAYISGSSSQPADINYTGSFIHLSGSYDNKIVIGTCVTDANVGSNNLYVVGDVAGTTKITIGSNHTNSGTLSSVAGGTCNTVLGTCGFIGGGRCNYISANVTTAPHVIGGGNQNCVSAYNTSGIFGGNQNKIQPGFFTGNIFIVGGTQNQVTSSIDHGCLSSSLIGGGGNNKICGCGNSSAILGGCTNTISKHCSVIGGGKSNSANGTLSSILGGTTNTTTGACSFIGGGSSNSTSGPATVIVGGRNHCIHVDSCDGVIVGGFSNYNRGDGAFIGAGSSNTICLSNASYAVIVGGTLNTASCGCSFIGGGCSNFVCECYSVIVGGENGTISDGSFHSFIGGGKNNYIAAWSSSIVGGFNNTIANGNSHIIGSNLTTDKSNYTFVNNLDVEGTVSASIFSGSFVGDGSGLTNISAGSIGAAGSNTQVQYNNNGNFGASSNFTYDGTTLDLTYTGTGDLLRLTSTDAGASSAPDLTFCRNSASPADDDTLGNIQFWGKSSAPANKLYAAIYGRIACATSGQTKGNISFKAECNNVFIDTANFSPNGLYVMPPDDFAITSPGIGLTVTGAISGSGKLYIGSADTNTTSTSALVLNGTEVEKRTLGTNAFNSTAFTTCTGTVTGTGANDRVAIWTGTTSLDSNSNFTYDGTTLTVGSKLTVGASNTNSGNGSSIAGGINHSISTNGDFSFIGGGCTNTVDALHSIIGSGRNNCIRCNFANYSIIGGGYCNTIYSNGGLPPTIAYYSAILGGCGNKVSDTGGSSNTACFSNIVGGQNNKVISCHSSIVGGTLNTGSGDCSFIGGGQANAITSGSSVIGGGCDNCITGIYDFIGGGISNCICNAKCSSIVGGDRNIISGSASSRYHFIGGGLVNKICIPAGGPTGDSVGTIVGGYNNCLTVGGATIVGGTSNTNSGYEGFIGGGNAHTVSGCYSSVVAGRLNSVSGCCSAIVNGCINIVTSEFAFIGGGCSNCITGDHAVIAGGRQNCANNVYSSVGGGYSNAATTNCSTIAGGYNNCTCTNSWGFIGGGHTNIAAGASSVVAGGYNNKACGCQGFIGAGQNNTISSTQCYGIIVGGQFNTIDGTGCSNTIGGGGTNNCIHISNGCDKNTISGGGGNCILCNNENATVGGGASNIICRTSGTDYGSTIAGGAGNCLVTATCWSFIGGGRYNCSTSNRTVIGGGEANTGSGCFSVVGGGNCNTAGGIGSSVLGGVRNSALGNCSVVVGGANNLASGLFSYAGGEGSLADAAQSFAHGYFVTASGGAAAAFGALTQADGYNAFAVGTQNLASNTDSVAFGYQTCAVASQSMATGYQTCAAGASSLAGGGVSCAIGGNSIAWGTANCACGFNSFALGCTNTSRGNQSFVAGFNNCIGTSALTTNTLFGSSNCINSGENNFIIGGGSNLISVGSYSQIGGQCNSIVNDIETSGYATVFGNCNCANGCASYSFSHGRFNLNFSYAGVVLGQGSTAARGDQQFAFGCCVTNPNNGTSANIANSMVIGRFNVWNISDCHLFAVGNGSSDGSRTNAFNVSSNGRVGVCCTSPQSALDVNGTTRTTTLVETSARRYKENIISLQDQLDNLKKLEPVEFEWKETKKKDIGLIAEDVEKIYPHLVEHDDNGDLMGVKYSKLTSVLIKALQEQQEQIDELKAEVKLLKQNK